MPISISRGKVHDYLGMISDYLKLGQVKINMYQYIEELLNSVPNRHKEGVGSTFPVPNNLYDKRSKETGEVKLLP